MQINQYQIATLIYNRLLEEEDRIRKAYQDTKATIGFFYIDDLLPEDIALKIYGSFPNLEDTVLKKSIREYKHVAVQMDRYDPILEDVIYAFQDKRIVSFFEKVCDLKPLYPDEYLYAGGLSLMAKDNFLNPHLDNSHDKDRNLWRSFNLLYYVSPDWQLENGGNLELWPHGLDDKQVTIVSKFNRLAVMATHNRSWHSVSKVTKDSVRCCVSNYYFSDKPHDETDAFHVTSFRGWPQQKAKDLLLKVDNATRMAIRKLFKKGIRENPHVYKKED